MPSFPSSRTSLPLLLLLLGVSFAAQAAETSPEAFLATHNTEAVRLNQTAMGVLLGWAVLNIGTGTALRGIPLGARVAHGLTASLQSPMTPCPWCP